MPNFMFQHQFVRLETGPSSDMPKTTWHPVATAPFDRDLELAVVEGTDVHALVFRCRRETRGWVNAVSGRTLDVDPTHWREWQDRTGGPL